MQKNSDCIEFYRTASQIKTVIVQYIFGSQAVRIFLMGFFTSLFTLLLLHCIIIIKQTIQKNPIGIFQASRLKLKTC